MLQIVNFYHLFQSIESASLGELKLPANGATTPFVKSSKRELEIKRKVSENRICMLKTLCRSKFLTNYYFFTFIPSNMNK